MKFTCYIIVLLFPLLSIAQVSVHELDKAACATPDISYEDWKEAFKGIDLSINKNTGFTQLPLRAHIVTLDNGTGGLTLLQLNIALANLNRVYHEASIEWFLADVNYIPSTAWYDFHSSEQAAMIGAHLVDDAVNVFFVDKITTNSGSLACGYAYYPFNSDTSLIILMDNGCTSTSVNGTFVHEFGHHTNLPHTHNGTRNGNTDPFAEHVPRTGAQSNCTTDGDFICDTEADPYGAYSGCNYQGTTTDIYGNLYTPNMDNIMSYYPDGCGGIFTPDQYTRISNGMTMRLGHSAYNIDGAAPNTVSNPSNLTVQTNGVSATVSWTDNASNEQGYLIERSDDGGVNFKCLAFGGVANNVSSFIDNQLVTNTIYKYRVKASNDDPDHYSNVVTINSDCQTTNLQFSGNNLIQSPVTISGLPTTIPSCQTQVDIGIKVVGDFGSDFEMCDILGEDGTTVLGQTAISSGDCASSGGVSGFFLTESQYNSWAGNGAITFYIDANINVNFNLCGVGEVTACAIIESCGSCPDDYAGPNKLTGTQSVNADFETDGNIESDQVINGNSTVYYDSGISIELLPGFNIVIGTIFEAFIDGCGNLFKNEEATDSSK